MGDLLFFPKLPRRPDALSEAMARLRLVVLRSEREAERLEALSRKIEITSVSEGVVVPVRDGDVK